MAIKKIAYDTYAKATSGFPFDSELEAKTHLAGNGAPDECDDTFKIFEYDFDPAVDYLSSLEMNAAGTALVNPFAGKTIDEQKALVEKRDVDTKIRKYKQQKKHQTKMLAKEAIEELVWKIDRAKDLDVLNGNQNALRAAYQEREDVRVKSNAMEAEIEALTTLSEVYAYSPKKILDGIVAP
tara:strand:+ start:396 stop:941 length:546 start_codon:yes stop_codon:yes gene_type:complete